MSQGPIIRIGEGSHALEFGGSRFLVVAGPCSIESLQQFMDTARSVKNSGAAILRGGIYKLRTNPDSFQGLGKDAYKIAKDTCQELGMLLVSEIVDPRHVEDFLDVVDVFQIGTRNMYNYPLLKEVGQTGKPVILKRAFSAPLKEWVLAADYIANSGNEKIILCERGIRTFESATRNTLDLAAIPYIKQETPYPIIIDPSHGTGVPDFIPSMAKAAAAAGADGLMIEVHPDPPEALSDGHQALRPEEFESLMAELKILLPCVGREL